MKRFLSMILVLSMLVMCFALTACNNTTTEEETKTPAEDAVKPEENKTSEEEKPEEETPVEPVAKEKLVMATNAYFQPYEYYDGDKIVGIDAEIAAAIAEYLGMELEISDMNFDSIITAVKTGTVNFGMAGMTVTEERLQEINFSISYASGVQSIIVKEDSAITTPDDLYVEGASQKVGVQLGTTGDIYASDDFGADRVVQYENGNNAVLALLSGDVDCVIIDNEPAKALVAANEGLKILDTSYAEEDYAICVAKENTELLDKINEAILALTANGKIAEIVAKYIK
ncbi:MAG: transporter substrate-binding domain-containing protein [Ruminococcaceae bacterium]|nr:transporter substrate-binding domain-containing protein [Oscillospiraceae bacterium]